MSPCECFEEKINRIIKALREMDDKEFEALLSSGDHEGRKIDDIIEEILTKNKKTKIKVYFTRALPFNNFSRTSFKVVYSISSSGSLSYINGPCCLM